MDMKPIKTAFFGYDKSEVCQYIAQLNTEFSDKLVQLSDESKKIEDELKEKLVNLETKSKETENELKTKVFELKSSLEKKDEENSKKMSSLENTYKQREIEFKTKISKLEDEKNQLTEKLHTATSIQFDREIKAELAKVQHEHFMEAAKRDTEYHLNLTKLEEEKSKLTEDFNSKLAAREAELNLEMAKKEEEYQAAIKNMETENLHTENELRRKIAELEEELKASKMGENDISNAIIEAKQYSTKLKADADRAYEESLADIKRLHAEQSARVERYRSAIDSVRHDLAVFADETDQALKSYLVKVSSFTKECDKKKGAAQE